MKILIINGSPRKDTGITGMMLNPLLEGIKAAGETPELFYSHDMNDVAPCEGCLDCLFKTPGRCSIIDGMENVYNKFETADLIILVTPLFHGGMTSTLKKVLDRLGPVMEPFSSNDINNQLMKPLTEKYRSNAKFLLISTCAFWEMEQFDPLTLHIQRICRTFNWDYLPPLLRTQAWELFLSRLAEDNKHQFIFDALKEAGIQLIKNGAIEDKIYKTINNGLSSKEEYKKCVMNAVIEKMMKKQRKKTLVNQNIL
jgi:hypothetical protein